MKQETILIEGKFSKANIPAIVSFIIALCLLVYSYLWGARLGHSIIEAIYYDYYSPFFFGGLPLIAISLFFIFWMSNCHITITDKRVYGVAAFKKRVDLPFDMISAVGGGIFNRLTVATSSGRITFYFLKNRDDIFDVITNRLIERQELASVATIKQEIVQSNADELKKYKELFDSGVISQEEFEQKKKQLLGL